MGNIRIQFIILTLAFIVSLNAGQADAAMPSVVKTKCAGCHNFERGVKHKSGPNLYDIFDRMAGAIAAYRYYPGLKNSEFFWTPDRLRLWLANPRKAIRTLTGNEDARTKMPDPKLSAAEIDKVVAYLSHSSVAKTTKSKMPALPKAKLPEKNGGTHTAPKPVRMQAPAEAASAPASAASSVTWKKARDIPKDLSRMEAPTGEASASRAASRSPASVQPMTVRPKNGVPAGVASDLPTTMQHTMGKVEGETNTGEGSTSGSTTPISGSAVKSMPSAAANGHGAAPAARNGHSEAASPSGDIFAEVDRILAELPEGNIAFNTPQTMNLKETGNIELILSMQKTIEELKTAVKAEGEKHGASIKVSRLMEARLTGANFQITAINDDQQAVSYALPTAWKWEVQPKSEGSHALHLTLDVVFEDKSKRTIRSFDKSIMVEVTAGQRFDDFVSNNFQWLWSVLLVPLFAWGLAKYRGKKKNAWG